MLSNFIPYSTQFIDESDKNAVLEALFSTHLTQGSFTNQFEEEIAKFIGIKHAISFNSATSALYAAFRATKEFIESNEFTKSDIFADSKHFQYAKKNKSMSIITTPISFVATTNMMLAHGITPIFADISMNGNLKLEGIESLLREDTIAICSVDYGGNSVDMQAFSEFAKAHKILWISDSSHAFGAKYRGEMVGSKADMSIFSFHAVKPITTCEGGALVCNNDFFDKIARLVCSHGIEKKSLYNHECTMLGFNFRMNEIGASLGLSQLKKIESFLQIRQEIANFYNEYFKDNPYFYPLKHDVLAQSTHHLYPILLDPRFICMKESIANDLVRKNIGVQVHYKPIYNFKLYQQFGYPILRNAEDFYHAELSIPCHQHINLALAKIIADEILRSFDSLQ